MTIEDRDGGSTAEPRSVRAPRPSRPTRHDLERYASLFAARTSVMKSSAMRDLMALTERPEVISLAGGLPDTSTFQRASYAAIQQRVGTESLARALQYGPTEGLSTVKGCIVEVMAEEGTAVDPEDLLVTTGGQQAIDLVCKTLVDPGDVVVAEAPTYPGAVPTFSSYQADVVQIGLDADGLRIDELEETLERLDREGRRPKFLYTVPTFQNPAGVTMSLPRRRRLVEVARERELLVVEDNPYGLLRYSGEALPTLHSLEGGEFVLYLGTFSKILSPGIRLGWVAAPGPVLEKLNMGKQATDLCSSAFTQVFVSTFFDDPGAWLRYLDVVRETYRGRRDAMLGAMDEHLSGIASWTAPEGGLFLWATLPDYLDTTDLLARALTRNVAFVPGRGAFLDGRGGQSMRLNFSGVGEDDIREGVRRIGAVVHEQVALYGTLTGHTAPAVTEGSTEGAPADDTSARVVHLPPRREPGSGRGAQA